MRNGNHALVDHSRNARKPLGGTSTSSSPRTLGKRHLMSNGRVRVGMLGAGFIILMHLLEVRNHHVGQDTQRAAEPIQPRPASGVSRLSLGRWGKIHGFDAVPSAVAAGNHRRWLPRIRLARLYRCSHRLSPDRLAGQRRLDTRATFPPTGWTEPSTPQVPTTPPANPPR